MATNRRAFIRTSASVATGFALAKSLTACSKFNPPSSQVRYLSSAKTKEGSFLGVMLGADLDIVNAVTLPRRAHAAVFHHANREALFFSRRPGSELFVMDASSNTLKSIVPANAGRHFYGHGVLSADGQYLFTTENAFESGQGIISVRDTAAHYKVIKEIPSFGIGPHELGFLSDGKTLAVANGGLRTHPNKNRVPSNVDTMAPNISFIDTASGRLLSQYEPPNHKMSLRHMSIDANDDVYIAVQYMGPILDQVPLLVKAKADQGLSVLGAPANFSIEQKQYSSSTVVKNGAVLMSCPKNNALSFWLNDRLHSMEEIKDVAGVCLDRQNNEFVFSGGAGDIGRVHMKHSGAVITQKIKHQAIHWDNHLIAV